MGPAPPALQTYFSPFSGTSSSFAFFDRIFLLPPKPRLRYPCSHECAISVRLLTEYGTKFKGLRIQFLMHSAPQRYMKSTYLCTGRDVSRSDLTPGIWLSGSRTLTHMFCHQKHRGVWTGTWSNAGYIEGLCHGRLLKTEGSKKKEGERYWFCLVSQNRTHRSLKKLRVFAIPFSLIEWKHYSLCLTSENKTCKAKHNHKGRATLSHNSPVGPVHCCKQYLVLDNFSQRCKKLITKDGRTQNNQSRLALVVEPWMW